MKVGSYANSTLYLRSHTIRRNEEQLEYTEFCMFKGLLSSQNILIHGRGSAYEMDRQTKYHRNG